VVELLPAAVPVPVAPLLAALPVAVAAAPDPDACEANDEGEPGIEEEALTEAVLEP